MKRVRFSENLGHLIDEEGKKYEGKRLGIVSINSYQHHSHESAERSAENKLLDVMEKKGAKAYEVVSLCFRDSRQEYDPAPFDATYTVILYKE